MTNAQNGARIKAWAGPNVGSGIVQNITFTNFIESKVGNPVVIDQVYFPSGVICSIIINQFLLVLHDRCGCMRTVSFKYVHPGYIFQLVCLFQICTKENTYNPVSISGTGTGSVVAALSCSPGARCSNINVNNLSLT